MVPSGARPSFQPFFSDRTGHGVRVAIIDSGVHAEHPHLGGVMGGISIGEDGSMGQEYVDRLGHGTAVAAVIREKAPQAQLFAVKVFFDSLSTRIESLLAAIRWAAQSKMNLINLSLGINKEELAEAMEEVVRFALDRGAMLVAPLQESQTLYLPGRLPGVIPVCLDWECPRSEYRVTQTGSEFYFAASGYPRDIPGVPPSRNLKGLSFAVANMSGFAARALEGEKGGTVQDLIDRLISGV